MNKIHFCALFGVDLDIDIVHQWAQWYRRYDFDRYGVYLQSNRDISEEVRQDYMALFRRYGFWSAWIPENFQYGKIRLKYIGAYHKTMPHGDYLVCADSDELHGVEPDRYRSIILKNDLIFGHTVDRYSTELKKALPGMSLFEQYEKEGDVKARAYCGGTGIYRPVKRRILAARSHVAVNYAGSHYTTGGPYEEYGDYPVYHFAYRHNCLDRMARKAYYTAENLYKIARFFGMDWHPAIDEKIEETETLQKEKGWVST